ncbi:ABC transporter substrate-binding protein [Candidatus Trichorickettsia mobilis]|uniref:ABC transporter substrate-binding protein n=1 Tax=Candidatus Trichorickettsia mobilis TaxID=1346319 RepID=A0ABZ0UWK5_9RICK|nr:ABC transporter substrate-binding protein [Candidatus Trichorickettsia mobilis]WPY00997.1 ABC transporter substrate-binding protein [Candidatus Trichorickettsia mobilis]
MIKIIRLICISIICIVMSALADEQHKAVDQYVDKLVDDAQIVLHNTKLTDEERSNKSKALIAANLDLNWMAKYTLGRYKKQLAEKELQEFIQSYSQYVIKTYADLVKNYKGEKATIKQVETVDTNEFIVRTEVIKTNGQPPIKVDYFVKNIANNNAPVKFLIADVITEGISMINSQRSEFDSILTNNGIAVLIATLKKKL